MKQIYIKLHALDRYREHYPAADFTDMEAAYLYDAQDIDPGLVSAILQRRGRTPNDTYRLSSDCRGIFVVHHQERFELPTLITYIRLQPSQQAILQRSPI
jgi:hypothetical protein